MSRYFTFSEMTRSATASLMGIDNEPDAAAAERLNMLMDKLLDPVREMWGGPLRVTSGYRCIYLNRAVGGAVRSQHLRGEAADITTGSREGNRRLFAAIEARAKEAADSDGGALEFDQLIDERNYAWLHLSYSQVYNRKQTLHL